MADVFTDHRIATRWPDKWAACRNSKARNNLRKRFRIENELAQLREAGASCGNCSSYQRNPTIKKFICEAGSDFHGYQLASADGLCTDWSEAKQMANFFTTGDAVVVHGRVGMLVSLGYRESTISYGADGPTEIHQTGLMVHASTKEVEAAGLQGVGFNPIQGDD